MSNHLAIATVTALLSQMLTDAVSADVAGATASSGPPTANGDEDQNAEVRIYLYQVTPNGNWRNADLPTRRANGELAQLPQAALDLYYLLSFHGSDAELVPQRLLGSVSRAMHTRPVLTRQAIRDFVDALAGDHYLRNADLADQPELVRFTPVMMDTDELSRLWSVFFQIPHVLSVAYQASVVLIEPSLTPRVHRPVATRNVSVVPFEHAVIERVTPIVEPGGLLTDPPQPVLAESSVRLEGRSLRGQQTSVQISGNPVPPGDVEITGTRIDMTLPPGLLAGLQGAQISHAWLIGTPPEPRGRIESNIASFVLNPAIPRTNGDFDITVENIQADDGTRSADITLGFDPPVGKRQRVLLILIEFNPPDDRAPRAYSFGAPSRDVPGAPDTVDELTIPVSGVIAGEYLVRVLVDGAESPLEIDTNDASDTFGQPVQPRVVIA